jgi:carbamate kinase
LLQRGEHLVLTHGNGPQVGFMQLRSEMACAELRRRGSDTQVVTIVTEVEVDANDPAFDAPNKPIGRFFELAEAEPLARERGWELMTDPRRGVRRVVASPQPQRIVQLSTIEQLCDLGITVICCGGGGISVSRTEDGEIVGHEAVIDKDRVSMLLAKQLGARRLAITTSVDYVYEDFYTDTPTPRPDLTVGEVRALHAQGQFAEGSMAPKMEAAIDFLEATDGEVVICQPSDLVTVRLVVKLDGVPIDRPPSPQSDIRGLTPAPSPHVCRHRPTL